MVYGSGRQQGLVVLDHGFCFNEVLDRYSHFLLGAKVREPTIFSFLGGFFCKKIPNFSLIHCK